MRHTLRVRRVLLAGLLAVIVAASVASCGRKGPLEPRPPESQSPVTGKVMPA